MDKYPDDWPAIAERIKVKAEWKCQRCGAPNSKTGGTILTVHHLNGLKFDCRACNLVALCQKCHLSFQAHPDDLDQEFVFGNSFVPWYEILKEKYSELYQKRG